MFRLPQMRIPAMSRLVACGCLLTSLTAAQLAYAQQSQLPDVPPEAFAAPDTHADAQSTSEQTIREELRKLRTLEITQRRAMARALISKYPNTEAGRLVERYLHEMELYDQAAQAQREVADARGAVVREFWRQYYTAELSSIPNYRTLPLVRITNQTNAAVLYQLRGYGMDWTRPRFLEAGQTDEVNYAVEYRRITSEGTELYSLQPGSHYVFQQSSPDGLPHLFQAPAPQ